jgi:hypothetical protein
MKMEYFKTNLLAVLLLVFVLLVIFPGHAMPADTDRPPGTNRMRPDHAPTPFSAEEIYAGCPRDREIVFQVEAFGQPVIFQTMKFVTVYENKVVFESITTGTDGKQQGPRRITTGTWKDLQEHASFPEKQTTIQKESLTVPAGTFDCWRYDVTLGKDGKTNVQRYWFALNLPGPPICFEETVDARVAYKMTMLKNSR